MRRTAYRQPLHILCLSLHSAKSASCCLVSLLSLAVLSVVSADVEVGNARDSTQDVAWGPLVFEARRFVELRKKSLWQQCLSAESFGMGLFYTLNVSSLLAWPCSSLGNMHG